MLIISPMCILKKHMTSFFSDDCCGKIQSSIKKKLRRKMFGIKNLTLCNWIYTELKDYIKDSHFAISVCGREWRFVKKYSFLCK